MFEKLLVIMIMGVMIISLVLHMNGSHYAFALLFFTCLVCCWQYIRILFTIYSKLSSSNNQKYFSSRQLAINAAIHISQQKQMASLVIREIEKIGYDRSMEVSNQIDGDTGIALVCLKTKIEAYKAEESIRNWVMEGIAMISELRKSVNSFEEYANKVLAQLVKYQGANLGAFYILRTDPTEPQILELVATYAYGKRSDTEGKVLVNGGQGQLEQCVIEKEIIILSQVPKDYLRITSGLGEATPKSVLIAPLVFNNQVYGAIELASFQVPADYQIDFLRKVCVNIAVELSSILAHQNTEVLLKQTILAQEQTKLKEQQISIKLQEVEAERSKNIAILNGCMDGVISFDEMGIIGFANLAAAEIFSRSQERLVGSDIQELTGVHVVRNGNGVDTICSPSGNEITVRTEVTIKDSDLSLLLTSARVKVNGGYVFTLFIQKISVDLF